MPLVESLPGPVDVRLELARQGAAEFFTGFVHRLIADNVEHVTADFKDNYNLETLALIDNGSNYHFAYNAFDSHNHTELQGIFIPGQAFKRMPHSVAFEGQSRYYHAYRHGVDRRVYTAYRNKLIRFDTMGSRVVGQVIRPEQAVPGITSPQASLTEQFIKDMTDFQSREIVDPVSSQIYRYALL